METKQTYNYGLSVNKIRIYFSYTVFLVEGILQIKPL